MGVPEVEPPLPDAVAVSQCDDSLPVDPPWPCPSPAAEAGIDSGEADGDAAEPPATPLPVPSRSRWPWPCMCEPGPEPEGPGPARARMASGDTTSCVPAAPAAARPPSRGLPSKPADVAREVRGAVMVRPPEKFPAAAEGPEPLAALASTSPPPDPRRVYKLPGKDWDTEGPAAAPTGATLAPCASTTALKARRGADSARFASAHAAGDKPGIIGGSH